LRLSVWLCWPSFLTTYFRSIGSGTGGTNDLGEVAGTTVYYRDFEARVAEQEQMYLAQSGQSSLEPQMLNQLRDQIWNDILKKIILGKEMDELGLTVTNEELAWFITGPQPHQIIVQNFTDPNTGQLNPAMVTSYWNNMDQLEPNQKAALLNIERMVREDRVNTKYNTLVSKGLYVTTAEAKRSYVNKNKQMNFRFVALRYNGISDSAVNVTEEEIKKYYEENKWEHEQETNRDFVYVVFDVMPSEDDISKVRSDFDKLVSEFDTLPTEELESFVNYHSDAKFNPLFIKPGEMHPAIDTAAL
jgi:peptidyl-prolyl cis-trans isomerase D